MAANPPFLVQPAFDPRILSLTYSQGAASSGQLMRGFMIWDDLHYGYKKKARVNFLYNPSTITASYDMQDSTVEDALMWQDASDQASVHVPLQQTVSWSLLYDRTFELWGSYAASGAPNNWKNPGSPMTDPTVGGCVPDIMAVEQFTGMLVNANQGGVGKDGSNSYGIGANTKRQGPMMLASAWVYFGAATGLNYYGYVSDWSLQVTHWTQYMVPMRCVINIDFNLFPPPVSEPGTGTGVENWWSLIGTPGPPNPPVTTIPPTVGVGGR